MSLPRLLILLSVLLFGGIGVAALIKGCNNISSEHREEEVTSPIEIELEEEEVVITPIPPSPSVSLELITPPAPPVTTTSSDSLFAQEFQEPLQQENLPDANRIGELFNIEGAKLPIVETIRYKSKVPWLEGRPAWLSDYASHYKTSRHFIARSLNGKPDYFKQDIIENARFNVFRSDKDFQFRLLVDLSRLRAWFYYEDLGTKERVLLKTYPVGIGRVDGSKVSGLLTPLGQYSLGSKVAIYKPKMMGHHQGKQVEMMTVFGSRWIPFDKEIKGCTASAKGLGLHGVPWNKQSSGELAQNKSNLGKCCSDGCIQMASEDVEEFFAIVITKPTVIEIVKNFYDSPNR